MEETLKKLHLLLHQLNYRYSLCGYGTLAPLHTMIKQNYTTTCPDISLVGTFRCQTGTKKHRNFSNVVNRVFFVCVVYLVVYGEW